MTAQPLPLQTLIDEIDGVLSKASPRLPWVMAGDVDQQRRLLEQTRNYLITLQQQANPTNNLPVGNLPVGNLPVANLPVGTPPPGVANYDPNQAPFPQGGLGHWGNISGQAPAESAQQVLQSLLQEMSYLRASIMQPMRMDVESLRQERDALLQEVRQLESQRQQGLAGGSPINQQQIITEFLQSLMGRMQETLTAQVGQMLGNAQVMALQDRTISTSSALATGHDDAGLTPSQRLEQIQMLQTQSDQLLLKLDSTLKVFFESLQRNVHSYQDSLNDELTKMHMLGSQGEAVLSGLINRLAQQLGREASTYLQSPTVGASLAPSVPTHATSVPRSLDDPITFLQPDATEELDDLEKAQIDQLLVDLRKNPLTDASGDKVQEPATQSSNEVDVSELDLLNLDLEGLDLDNTAEDELLSEIDEGLTFSQSDEEEITEFQLDDQDLTFLQVNDQDWSTLQAELTLDEPEQKPPAIANLDSAVALLSQLNLNSSEPDTDPSGFGPDPLFGEMGDAPINENRYDEIDDFYESLFGTNAAPPRSPEAATLPTEAPETSVEAQSISFDQGPLFLADLDFSSAIAPAPPAPTAEIPDESEPIFTLNTDLESELFDGFSDPAIDATDPAPTSDFEQVVVDASLGLSSSMLEPPDHTQTDTTEEDLELEGILFGEGESATTEAGAIANEDDFLRWEDAITEGETTTADSILPQFEPISLVSNQPISFNQFEEERFELASPEEDLLAVEPPSIPARLDLSVDDWTLEQLQQDLSVFEGNPGEDWATLVTETGAPESEPSFPEPLDQPEPTAIFDTNDLQNWFPEIAPPAPTDDFSLELSAPEPSEATPTSLPTSSPMDSSGDLEALFPGNLFAPEPLPSEPLPSEPLPSEPLTPEPPEEAIAPSSPAYPTEPLPPELTSSGSGVASALSDDFLAELLGEAPVSTEIIPPALDVQAVLAEPSPSDSPGLAEQPTLESSLFDQPVTEADLFEDLSGLAAAERSEVESASAGNPVADNPFSPRQPIAPSENTPASSTPREISLADWASTAPPIRPIPSRPVAPFVPATEATGTSARGNEDITLNDLFNLSETESSQPPTPNSNRTLDDFAIAMPAPPLDPASTPPPATPASNPSIAGVTEFTLEGLDVLFEDLPSLQTQPTNATPPVANRSVNDLELTLESLFGADFGSQASLDLYNQPPDDPTQKKRPN